MHTNKNREVTNVALLELINVVQLACDSITGSLPQRMALIAATSWLDRHGVKTCDKEFCTETVDSLLSSDYIGETIRRDKALHKCGNLNCFMNCNIDCDYDD
jgi:hypothetical protein